MARRLSTGVAGRNVLGSFVAVENNLRSVIDNADVVLQANGTGIARSATHLQIDDANSLRLADADSSAYVALRAPNTVASDVVLTLPDNEGSANQVLTTDGSGELSWTSAAITVTDQISDSATYYPALTTATTGTISNTNVSSTKLSFQPSTGTLTATAYVETSSIKLKENIAPIENALDIILMLNGVTYDRKDKSAKDEPGLIAEQVNEVLPNLVTKDEFGNPHGINYTKFSAYLIEAVKELSMKVNHIKTS